MSEASRKLTEAYFGRWLAKTQQPQPKENCHTMTLGNYQITLRPVNHRGFGIIRPDQELSYYQWMIGCWWCLAIRIEPQPRKPMAVYHD
jgi:hypothetical protein